MSFNLIVLAAAIFACQANAQLGGGIIRPFITGYANGLSEFTKPFVQLGQTVMSPATEFFPSTRPQIGQWLIYPNQQRPIVPPTPIQAQPPVFDGYETLTSFPAGSSIVQFLRPRPLRPQIYPAPSQPNFVAPPRPYPAPAPAPSSSSEESGEVHVPTTLLIQPDSVEVSAENVPTTLEATAEDAPIRPLPLSLEEDKE